MIEHKKLQPCSYIIMLKLQHILWSTEQLSLCANNPQYWDPSFVKMQFLGMSGMANFGPLGPFRDFFGPIFSGGHGTFQILVVLITGTVCSWEVTWVSPEVAAGAATFDLQKLTSCLCLLAASSNSSWKILSFLVTNPLGYVLSIHMLCRTYVLVIENIFTTFCGFLSMNFQELSDFHWVNVWV